MLDLVHRNGLRLQKLVNTLLDFSRIEAGRIQADYEPTDLARFTEDLASTFPFGHGEGRARISESIASRFRHRSTSIATCGRRLF